MTDKGKAKVGDGPSWWDQGIDPKYCFRYVLNKELFLVVVLNDRLGFFSVVVLNKEYSLYIHALAIVYFLF